MRRLALSLLLLTSCDVGNDTLYTASISEKNINNLARLEVGMSQPVVLQIMRKPYEAQQVQMGSDTYELWYYVTTMTGLGQTRMVPQNLTPLAFKNGVLVGWGYEYYKWLNWEQRQEKKPRVKPADEDKPLEKALESKPAPVPAAPITMSKPPAKKEEPPAPPKKEKKPPLSQEDEEMLEQESEQNFDFW